MTKEQLAKLGIKIDTDEVSDEEGNRLIAEHITKLSSDNATLSSENAKQKELISKRNSEIADFKKKEQDAMSEEEKRKAHYEELEKTNQSLTRELALNKRIADYVGIGYDTELAKQIAEAELDGKSTAQLHKKYYDKKAEELKAELMKNSGGDPHTNTGDGTVTKEQFDKMSYEDRLKLHNEHPEVYAQFTEKK